VSTYVLLGSAACGQTHNINASGDFSLQPTHTTINPEDSVIILDNSYQDQLSTSTEISQTGSEELQCTVVKCWTKFTNSQKMLQHMNNFVHSPCNPLVNYPDNDVNGINIGFSCPQCWSIFQVIYKCTQRLLIEKKLNLKKKHIT